jgi:hypothetical protein
MPEVLRAPVSKEDDFPVHRSQTPVSTALELLIDSLCLEQGWETSSSEASPTHADGNAGGNEVGDHADKFGSRSEGASPGASRSSAKSRTSKPARVRFKDEEDGSGAGPSGQDEGLRVGEVVNDVAPLLTASSQKQNDSAGVSSGPLVAAADEFDNLALRFHKQPVKVSG